MLLATACMEYLEDRAEKIRPNTLDGYRSSATGHGLPYVPMKNLRHTWATQALERGVSIEEIMMYLGHTNIDTSYEHYLRRTDTLVERISAKFEQ